MTKTERAELARQVTENPAFRLAVKDMREAFIAAWLATNEGDQEKRDLAWRHVKFLDVFVGVLNGYIDESFDSKRHDLP